MNTWRQWSCVVLTIFALVLDLQTIGVCKGDKPNFYATVQDQFPTWDLNHDGALSGNEILQAFEDPKYVGQAAAAIAVLQQLETERRSKKNDGYSGHER